MKKHLVTAPANKVFPFGGDYIPVEPVLGHSLMVRQGVAQALRELMEENWLELRDAVDLIQPIMSMNARTFFQLDRKGLI